MSSEISTCWTPKKHTVKVLVGKNLGGKISDQRVCGDVASRLVYFWVVPPSQDSSHHQDYYMYDVCFFFSEPEIASKTRYIMQHQAPKNIGEGINKKQTYEKSIKKKYCHVQNRLEPGRVRQTHGIFTYIWLILNDKLYSMQKRYRSSHGGPICHPPKTQNITPSYQVFDKNLLDLWNTSCFWSESMGKYIPSVEGSKNPPGEKKNPGCGELAKKIKIS